MRVPSGSRPVYGMQLPVQSQSTLYAEPWEADAGPQEPATPEAEPQELPTEEIAPQEPAAEQHR